MGMFDKDIYRHDDQDDEDRRGESTSDDDTKSERKSVATQLAELGLDEYTLGISDTDEPFGIKADRPHIVLPLRGGETGLRTELARRYYREHGKAASQSALADAVQILLGEAAETEPRRVSIRVADCDGAVYIDTGDTDGNVIVIDGGKWHVTNKAAVLFRRTRLTAEMAKPIAGGDLPKLWEFVPINEADRPVLLAVLVAALIQTDVPHVVLALLAEQGSAKSSVTRVLVDLIDPSSVPLRKPPRDDDQWSVAAMASWVVALDNLPRTLPDWLSNALCRASTGDGDVKRQLYSDGDVAVRAFRRCVILTGIDLTFAGDLADRIVTVDLPRIARRRRETELAAAWEKARPAVFGGLLDLATQVHQLLPDIEVDDPPRMADFAQVLAAVDKVLGTSGLDRYREQAQQLAADSLNHPFTSLLMSTRHACVRQTATEILDNLPLPMEWKRPREWPTNGKQVTAQLTADAPALRAQGWEIVKHPRAGKANSVTWTINPPEAG